MDQVKRRMQMTYKKILKTKQVIGMEEDSWIAVQRQEQSSLNSWYDERKY